MRKQTLMIAALLLLLILTSCGRATSSPDKQTGQTQPPTETAAPAPTDSNSGDSTASPEPGTETNQGDDASKETNGSEIEKSYHMNKNYDIVPNDENGEKKVVLLTFDDGPKQLDMNEALIATLDKHHAKAIFFMNGYRIKTNPDLLKFIYDSGQIIGNHSWDHINLKNESNEVMDKQVDEVNKIMLETVGEEPKFFRPPFGAGNDYLKEKVKNKGMLYMTWSNGSLDWEMTVKKNDPAKVISNVLEQLHKGSNILMHELPWTVEALDDLLTQLEEKGYSFVDPRAIELEMR